MKKAKKVEKIKLETRQDLKSTIDLSKALRNESLLLISKTFPKL